jgi:hypothetical protein
MRNLWNNNYQIFPPLHPKMLLWLDGNDPLGNGTPPADGTALSLWADKSGRQSNALQSNASFRPTYESNAINGRGAIQFLNASTQWMSINPGLQPASYVTAYVVVQTFETPATGTSQINYILARTTNSNFQMYLQGATSTLRFNATNTSSTQAVANIGAPTINTTYVMQGYFDGTNVGGKINAGTEVTAALTGTIKQGTDITYVGQGGGSNRYWHGYIAEIIVFGDILSSSDRLKMRQYLGNKFAVTVT